MAAIIQISHSVIPGKGKFYSRAMDAALHLEGMREQSPQLVTLTIYFTLDGIPADFSQKRLEDGVWNVLKQYPDEPDQKNYSWYMTPEQEKEWNLKRQNFNREVKAWRRVFAKELRELTFGGLS